jgi:hypothetical protein
MTEGTVGANPLRQTLRSAGTAAGLVGDVAFEGIKAITPKPIREAVGGAVEKIASTDAVQGIAKSAQKFGEAYPELSKDIGAIGNIAGVAITPGIGSAAKTGIVKGAEKVGEAIVKSGENTVKQAEKRIVQNVQDILRPTKTNKKQPYKQLTRDVITPNLPKYLKNGELDINDFEDLNALANKAKSKTEEVGDVMKEIEDSGTLKGSVNKSDLQNVLVDYKNKFKLNVNGKEIMTPEGTAAIQKIEQLDNVISELPDSIDVNEAIKIKRFFDNEVLTQKVPGVTADVSVATKAKEKMANLLRGAVRDTNKDYAKVLDKFRFFKTLEDVAKESAQRGIGQVKGGLSGKLIEYGSAGVGTIAGSTLGGVAGGGIGALLGKEAGERIVQALGSGKRKASQILKDIKKIDAVKSKKPLSIGTPESITVGAKPSKFQDAIKNITNNRGAIGLDNPLINPAGLAGKGKKVSFDDFKDKFGKAYLEVIKKRSYGQPDDFYNRIINQFNSGNGLKAIEQAYNKYILPKEKSDLKSFLDKLIDNK